MKATDSLKELVSQAVNNLYPDLKISSGDISLEHPMVEEHGDYSTSIALVLSKKLGKPGVEIAKEISDELNKAIKSIKANETRLVDRVEVAGPGFINFFLTSSWQVAQVEQVLASKNNYGRSDVGKGKTMVIDYSAPNIAKRFGIGHLRSTIIGQAIYNLFKFSGYETIGDNHLGDWGTQFGKILYMISHSAEKKTSSQDYREFTIDDLEKWYVEFHELAEKDPALEDRGREWFKKLEDGNKEARELWQKCIDISMTEFNKIYDLLDVKLDFAYGESFYENLMPEVIAEAKEKGISKESQGAWIIEIPRMKAPLILVKSDGATTYATRDLATLKFRKKEWNPDVVIYEVGAEQTLHFAQVFEAAKLLGYVKPETQLVHTKHGLYRWAHGKMSTRKGGTIKLEDILEEAIKRAESLGNTESAKAVGIGAIKYFDLKHNVQGDIVFDWEKMFELQGDSGPYLQYTYARARSVLRKSKVRSEKLKVQTKSEKLTPEEFAVLRYLYRFPEVVEAATRTFSPNLICSYLFELAKRFNNFYNNVPILSSPSPLAASRLQLTEATSIVLKNGLNLLGITALETM